MAEPRWTNVRHSITERTVHEARRSLFGWMIGLSAYSIWLLAMYPTIRDNRDITSLLNSYPEALRTLFQLDDFTSGPGYLRGEVFSLMMPLLLILFGVLWGTDAIAGEEDRRTIDLLLANPVSRQRVVFEKLAGIVAGVAAAALTVGLVLGVGARIVGLDVGTDRLVATVVACLLLALTYASIGLAIGAGTGHRGAARGVTLTLAVAAYLVSSLASLVRWLRPVRPLSPWYHALGVDPMRNGFLWWHLAVLIVLTAAAVVAGTAAFDRRDLAV
jgi:ABC-2 type transport system permease protein